MKRLFLVKSIFGSSLLIAFLLLAIWPIPSAFQAIPGCYHADNPAKEPPTDAVAAPDLRMLFEQGMAEAVISDEQLEEQRAVEAEQVEAARIWLADADPAERVSGAEQLSAYPTKEAEHYLIDALSADENPDVRAAAANSLSAFKEPDNSIFDALLAALQDSDEQVRFNAWSSLGILLNKPDLPPKTLKSVQVKLGRLLKKAHLTMDMRDEVREYLQEQQGL